MHLREFGGSLWKTFPNSFYMMDSICFLLICVLEMGWIGVEVVWEMVEIAHCRYVQKQLSHMFTVICIIVTLHRWNGSVLYKNWLEPQGNIHWTNFMNIIKWSAILHPTQLKVPREARDIRPFVFWIVGLVWLCIVHLCIFLYLHIVFPFSAYNFFTGFVIVTFQQEFVFAQCSTSICLSKYFKLLLLAIIVCKEQFLSSVVAIYGRCVCSTHSLPLYSH